MKDSFENYFSTRREKNFHGQKTPKIDKKKSVSTSQKMLLNLPECVYEYNFTRRKIKLAVTRVSQTGKKNGFHKPENLFLLPGKRLFSKN